MRFKVLPSVVVLAIGNVMASTATATDRVPPWLRVEIETMEKQTLSAAGSMQYDKSTFFSKVLLEKLSPSSREKFLKPQTESVRLDWQVASTAFKLVKHAWQDQPNNPRAEVLTTEHWTGERAYRYQSVPSEPGIHGVGMLESSPSLDVLPLQLRSQYGLGLLSKAIEALNLRDLGEDQDLQLGTIRTLEGVDESQADDTGKPISRKVVIKLSPSHGYTISSVSVRTETNRGYSLRTYETNDRKLINGIWMPHRFRMKDVAFQGKEVLSQIELAGTIVTDNVSPKLQSIPLALPIGMEFTDGRQNFFIVGPNGELKPNKDRDGGGNPWGVIFTLSGGGICWLSCKVLASSLLR
jgi:hypothetical protein